MQRIKSLEMNNGIIEMYISQMSDCYRAVLNDMIAAGNTSAVALALMVNSREGGGIAKALNTDTVQSSRASFARADEELESASRLVQSLTIVIIIEFYHMLWVPFAIKIFQFIVGHLLLVHSYWSNLRIDGNSSFCRCRFRLFLPSTEDFTA
jgi:hypothetical protein